MSEQETQWQEEFEAICEKDFPDLNLKLSTLACQEYRADETYYAWELFKAARKLDAERIKSFEAAAWSEIKNRDAKIAQLENAVKDINVLATSVFQTNFSPYYRDYLNNWRKKHKELLEGLK